MKVFVTEATGVLGTQAAPALVAAGHDVTAVARGPEKAQLMGSMGATPVTVDLFDPDAVKAAVWRSTGRSTSTSSGTSAG